jgi:Asp-tRNA(Asn)/Glu-tRNA(Gln) amidotransferase A subunit family amidase
LSNSPGFLPRLFPKPDQTIGGIGRALREGKTTSVEVLDRCLAQVDEWEPKVHAWVVLDRDRALEQSRALDDELKNGKDRGQLHGIPIGIKDLIDVAGLPTACGSKRWVNNVADSDAGVVANLREAGAVMMGKTVTTPYAWIDPPVTRNPWNLERTPGGSSSGSAAAVACGMCLGAIGTQTGGSITRPASFCGVAGMKPTKSFFDFQGVRPFARSLDHVGPIARSVDDLRILARAIDGARSPLEIGGEEDLSEFVDEHRKPPRLGRPRGYFDGRSDPAMRSEFEDSVRVLAEHGAEIIELDDPLDFEQVVQDHRRVMAAEAAVVHSDWLDEFPGDYPPRIRDLILEGRSLKAQVYLEARARIPTTMQKYAEAISRRNVLALITPATLGTAPDLSTTGDPAFNSPWSYIYAPTVSLPTGLASDGMPLAIQLIGWFQRDWELLDTAEWCEQAIRTWRR